MCVRCIRAGRGTISQWFHLKSMVALILTFVLCYPIEGMFEVHTALMQHVPNTRVRIFFHAPSALCLELSSFHLVSAMKVHIANWKKVSHQWRRALCSFTLWFLLWFIYSFVRLFIHYFFHSFIHSFFHSFINFSFFNSFIHFSFFDSFIRTFIFSLIYTLIHSFITFDSGKL